MSKKNEDEVPEVDLAPDDEADMELVDPPTTSPYTEDQENVQEDFSE